ncbi:rna-directed dna polymerase from mobile element jockey-like protein [Lasius niger]|uniref:Rna-directed dna polymerase from mobile element jockey-like protein n=1 Tax=Lasius niger TaxID=67767 RepID=A0A0J7K970_LASNI|nr:rna-directed dna polymerase from mobile element jockey-like protein [Lasius niger]
MSSVGLKQMVKEPTRIVNASATMIDLIFTNVELEVKVYHEPKITDHSMVVSYWNVSSAVNSNSMYVFRDYKRMDVDEFKRMIDLRLGAIEDGDFNDLANSAINSIVECLDKVAPKRSIRVPLKWQGKQWFSEEIRQHLRLRDEAHRDARISGSKDKWELFCHLRNKAVDICRKDICKRDYLESKLDKNKSDPKRMWETLKELMKGSSFGDNIYGEIQYGNNLYNDKREMANLFNKYYVDSVKSFRETDYKMDSIREVKYTECVFEVFSKIEIAELNRIVQNLANKNGTEEGINVGIMKIVIAVAGGKICQILNKSLEEGIFPDKWKETILIPIPKEER